MQRNWIGKSEGAEFDLPVAGRADLAIARLHDAARHRLRRDLRRAGARASRSSIALVRRRRERAARRALPRRGGQADRASSGPPRIVRSAACACTPSVVNPFTGRRMPLFLADYVLMGYGTGAIMAVPGEDQRDWEFAEQHGLPIIETVQRPAGWTGEAYTGDGVKINSGFLDGLTIAEAKRKAIDWLRRARAWRGQGQLPAARLGHQPPALLGRADSGRLLPDATAWCPSRRRTCRSCCRTTCSSRGKGGSPLAERGLLRQHHVPEVRRQGPARDRHDGHLRGVLLVLPPLLLAAATSSGMFERAGRRLLDAGRSVHRRHRARRAAPALRALLHQGAARPRPHQGRRAVSARC